MPGAQASIRGYIAFTPVDDGILGELTLAVAFDDGEGPNNNPPQDPTTLTLPFHDSLASVEADPERIDAMIQTNYELDLDNPIGTESGLRHLPNDCRSRIP